MMRGPGYYLYGEGDADWLGVLAGPFQTEEDASWAAIKWTGMAGSLSDEQIAMDWSEGEEL